MKTKYAVLNPANNEYTYTTQEELSSVIAKAALDWYTMSVQDNLYMQVQLNIDGSETWSKPNGEATIKPITESQLNKLVLVKMMEVTVL